MVKGYYITRLALCLIIAILIGVFSTQLLNYIHFLVGAVMVLYGLEGVFLPLTRFKKGFIHHYQFYLGSLEMLLGILMLSAIRNFEYVCIIWGTWTIVRESFELYETEHKIHHKFPAVFSLVLSIIEIIFSILLILFATEHHALTHIYLLIPEFVIYGLSPFLFYLYQQRKK